MVPTREEFLTISGPEKVLFYVLAVLAVAAFGWQIWRRSRLWMQGKPIAWKPRGIKGFLAYVLAQRKVRTSRKKSGAPMHLLIFYGFASLFLATTLLAVNTYSPVKFHQGTYYLIYEASFDALGLLLVVGVGWALFRRAWWLPGNMAKAPQDWWALTMLFVLGVTGYVLEAARLGVKMHEQGAVDSFDKFSFVGSQVASLLGPVAPETYKGIWWFHAVLAFGFIAVLPRMRLRHIAMAMFSTYGSEPNPIGELKPISMEEVEQTGQIGVAQAKDYSRWHLLSLDACMECGRCTDVCPANGVGKILNPKKVVQDIRQAMADGGSVADHVSEEALWACTTCNACVEACPVLIRHVDLIVDARRYLVAEGRFAGTGATMLRQLGSTGNAWGQQPDAREEWMKDLDIPLCRDGEEFDVLLWVGCAGATDPGAQRTTKAFAQLLKKAGVKFACLGREETCTGDAARRTGDEFLFQEKALANIEAFKRYGVKKVVTPCPHCMNTLKHEYRQFGAELEVSHHTQVLSELINERRIHGAEAPQGGITYHDPCYLARVNDESDAPRAVLGVRSQLNGDSAPPDPTTGYGLAEPKNRGRKTLCCGAGGGRMWMEESPDQRPGVRRAKELMDTGAETVAVGCPFCRIMLDASIKQVGGEKINLVDLAELAWERNRPVEEPDSFPV